MFPQFHSGQQGGLSPSSPLPCHATYAHTHTLTPCARTYPETAREREIMLCLMQVNTLPEASAERNERFHLRY